MTEHGLDAASAGLPPTLCGGLSARPSGVWGTVTCRSRAAADTAGCLHAPSLRLPENRHSCPGFPAQREMDVSEAVSPGTQLSTTGTRGRLAHAG